MNYSTFKKLAPINLGSPLSRLIVCALLFSGFLSSCTAPNQHNTPTSVIPIEASPKRLNSQETLSKPYVLLVSIDGFRHDYIEKFGAKNIAAMEKGGRRAESLISAYPTKTFPNHYSMEKGGRRAESLISAYPTKTFPNHYSIVTGMLPTTHGLVDNEFYDPTRPEKSEKSSGKFYSMSNPFAVRDGTWYGGEPLWTVAERSGMISASYFWVGSEAEIKGFRPSHYFNYADDHDNKKRVQQILKWLALPEDERPHMLTLYFSIVDTAGHKYGPDAKETGVKVAEADELIGLLRTELASMKLLVNLIVVSDHGMTALDSTKIVPVYAQLDLAKFEDAKVGTGNVTGSSTFLSLHSTREDDIKSAYDSLKTLKHAKAYLRHEIPAHYKIKVNSPRVGDIVIIADDGYYLATKAPKDPTKPFNQVATHGWDNHFQEMQGIFLAEGPNITSGNRLAPFENIHIYPLVLKILGLKTSEKIDGRAAVLDSIYTKLE